MRRSCAAGVGVGFLRAAARRSDVKRAGRRQKSPSLQFFELFGFDVLLDEALRPYLLEVNRSPSLGVGDDFPDNLVDEKMLEALKALLTGREKEAEEAGGARVPRRARCLRGSAFIEISC